MRTGTCELVGTLLVLLIDLAWAVSGPMSWGNNGECSLGNTQLSMIAKIIRVKGGTTFEWSIPDSATVMCTNVTSSTDQFTIRVKWSWDIEPLPPPAIPPGKPFEPPPKTTASDSKTASSVFPTTPSTKASTKADDSPAPTVPPVKSLEKRASHLEEKMDNENTDTSIELETSTAGTSAIGESSGTSLKPEATAGISATGFNAGTTDVSAVTTDISTSVTDTSTLTTDVASSTDVTTLPTDVSNLSSEGPYQQSTIIEATTDATTLFEVVTQRILRFSESMKPKGFLEKLEEPPEITLSCYPHCDSDEDTASYRLPGKYTNLMTLTVTRTNSLFHVSNIFIIYALPDEKVFHRVYWENVKLFNGPLEATHICENATKLPLHSRADLILQNVKLAAFLPQNSSEFPESHADCNCKYEEDEVNQFCQTAEIIMITVGAILGALLLLGLGLYIGKIYCESKRERDARDTLP